MNNLIVREGARRVDTACNFNCNQGRACPTRQACELPIDDGTDAVGDLWAAILVAAVSGVALIAAFLPVFA